MSSLSFRDLRKIEKLLDMQSGYVLDFSDADFSDFFAQFSIDIDNEKYTEIGTSKAKRLRGFFRKETDAIVGKVLLELIDVAEEILEGDHMSMLAHQGRLDLIPELQEVASELMATADNPKKGGDGPLYVDFRTRGSDKSVYLDFSPRKENREKQQELGKTSGEDRRSEAATLLLRNIVVSRSAARGLEDFFGEIISIYCSETGANSLPDEWKFLDQIRDTAKSLAGHLEQSEAEKIDDALAINELSKNIQALTEAVNSLEQKLKAGIPDDTPLDIFKRNLAASTGKSAGFVGYLIPLGILYLTGASTELLSSTASYFGVLPTK